MICLDAQIKHLRKCSEMFCVLHVIRLAVAENYKIRGLPLSALSSHHSISIPARRGPMQTAGPRCRPTSVTTNQRVVSLSTRFNSNDGRCTCERQQQQWWCQRRLFHRTIGLEGGRRETRRPCPVWVNSGQPVGQSVSQSVGRGANKHAARRDQAGFHQLPTSSDDDDDDALRKYSASPRWESE